MAASVCCGEATRVLDVGFDEDRARNWKDHGPENLALVRRMVAGLLQKEGTGKGGVTCKRKHAGWNEDYLLEVLGVSLA